MEKTYTLIHPAIPDREKERAGFVRWIDRLLRRSFDVVVSLLGLIFLSPVFALIAIFIRRDSPGPVFYRGKRLGFGDEEFGILKFRTMYERAESYAGTRVTAAGDDRITPFGHWLRDTKLNELPQLWNVLVGDMSLVGPRPEDPKIAEEWPKDVRGKILSVRPGITSPASVIYRDEESMLSGANLMEDYTHNILPSKLRLDQLYIRNRTMLTDLDVIFWTGIVLLPRLRTRPIPSHLLYWGPLSWFVNRILSWFGIDLMVALLATWVSGIAWRLSGPLDVGLIESFVLSIGLALLFSLFNSLLGLHRISWAKARAMQALDLVVSSTLASVLFYLIDQFALRPRIFPAGMLILTAILSAGGFVVVRYRERILTGIASRWMGIRKNAEALGEKVIIVGAGDMGEFASWLFMRGDFEKVFSVVGYVDDDPRKVGMVVGERKILGTTEQLPDLVQKLDASLVLYAIAHIAPAQQKRILSICHEAAARVVIFPDLMDAMKKLLAPVENLQSSVSIAEPGERYAPGNGQVKNPELDDCLDELDHLLEAGETSSAREYLRHVRSKITLGIMQ